MFFNLALHLYVFKTDTELHCCFENFFCIAYTITIYTVKTQFSGLFPKLHPHLQSSVRSQPNWFSVCINCFTWKYRTISYYCQPTEKPLFAALHGYKHWFQLLILVGSHWPWNFSTVLSLVRWLWNVSWEHVTMNCFPWKSKSWAACNMTFSIYVFAGVFLKFGFTPCKAEQPLQDMEF